MPVQIGKCTPVHAKGDVYLTGQPSPDDLKEAQAKGVKTVISLRESGETDWDEAARVKDLGMQYLHIPFKSPETLKDEVFDKVRQTLNDSSRHPVLVHCGSANRVGAVWLVHRVLDGGLTYDAALAEAKKIGLRTPAYEEKAKDYIARNHKPVP